MRLKRIFSLLLVVAAATAAIWAGPAWAAREQAAGATVETAATAEPGEPFAYFSFLTDPHYDAIERGSLWVVLLVAFAGLVYAGMLVGQVLGADQGTEKMRAVAEGDPIGGERLPRPPVPGGDSAGRLDRGILYFGWRRRERARFGSAGSRRSSSGRRSPGSSATSA